MPSALDHTCPAPSPDCVVPKTEISSRKGRRRVRRDVACQQDKETAVFGRFLVWGGLSTGVERPSRYCSPRIGIQSSHSSLSLQAVLLRYHLSISHYTSSEMHCKFLAALVLSIVALTVSAAPISADSVDLSAEARGFAPIQPKSTVVEEERGPVAHIEIPEGLPSYQTSSTHLMSDALVQPPPLDIPPTVPAHSSIATHNDLSFNLNIDRACHWIALSLQPASAQSTAERWAEGKRQYKDEGQSESRKVEQSAQGGHVRQKKGRCS
ncbi:unnamed protein product [Mycena citricolor]|uniref:Uncharacterized protein n=1 Tax=Mycena citricolor TaxID=2018698 RepID=A0AAD2H4E2_9AGAR|nr:unnamed protein product [Mycena citricolor]